MCIGVYDSPISCFSTYRSLNAIPQCSHSIFSWTTLTHLHRVDLNLMHRHTQPRTHWHSAHSSALSQALCVEQVDLCLLFLSVPLSVVFLSPAFFLYQSPFVSHTHTCFEKHVCPHTCKQITHPEPLHCHNDLCRKRSCHCRTRRGTEVFVCFPSMF